MHPLPMRWQLLPTLVLPGARNMALDEAMARAAHERGGVLLRVYGWMRPTLSFGRHQRAAGQYDATAAARLGVDVVRRPTGGRAVLHFREITYCVAAPEGALGSLRESYGALNEVLVDALRRLGVAAVLAAPDVPPPRPVAGACFETPVAGEIAAGGRKLVGSAQWRSEGALLQHGSILVDDDQGLANEMMIVPAPHPPPAATLRGVLGRVPALAEFAESLAISIEERSLRPVERSPIDRELERCVEALLPHYESERWTWRR